MIINNPFMMLSNIVDITNLDITNLDITNILDIK